MIDQPPDLFPVLFERQVARSPHEPAVVVAGRTLDYAELDARANRLARYLAGRGVGPERLVAVALGRSEQLLVAVLAVSKAGAAYLPVDPGYPVDRIRFMVADSRPVLVLADRDTADVLGGPDERVVLLDAPDIAAEIAAQPSGPLTDAERTAPIDPRHPSTRSTPRDRPAGRRPSS